MSEPVTKKLKSDIDTDIFKCILCLKSPWVHMNTGTIRDLCCNFCKPFCEPWATLVYTK